MPEATFTLAVSERNCCDHQPESTEKLTLIIKVEKQAKNPVFALRSSN